MAIFWVQHYYTLPIIFEDFGMGDELPPRQILARKESNDQLPTGM